MRAAVTLFAVLAAAALTRAADLTPCEDYECDSAVVREILDSNGLDKVVVVPKYYQFTGTDGVGVIDTSGGRVTRLLLYSRNLYGGNAPALGIPVTIQRLPSCVGRLSALEWFSVGDQYHLEAIPKEIGLLSNLRTLWADACTGLGRIPAEIGNLGNLELLSVRYDSLDSLPSTICNLSKLHTLIIDYNNLTALPEEIGRMRALKSIVAHDGQIRTLPESITLLSELMFVDLNRNELDALPDSIGRLHNLDSLKLLAVIMHEKRQHLA
jgi:hypothetical protein